MLNAQCSKFSRRRRRKEEENERVEWDSDKEEKEEFEMAADKKFLRNPRTKMNTSGAVQLHF